MLRRKLISPEQAEWCAYLVECKLEQMLCFSVLIALGCLIAPLWEVLLLNWGRRVFAPQGERAALAYVRGLYAFLAVL